MTAVNLGFTALAVLVLLALIWFALQFRALAEARRIAEVMQEADREFGERQRERMDRKRQEFDRDTARMAKEMRNFHAGHGFSSRSKGASGYSRNDQSDYTAAATMAADTGSSKDCGGTDSGSTDGGGPCD